MDSLLMRAVLLVLLVLGLTSCMKEEEILYTIKAGQHYSNKRGIQYLRKSTLHFEAKFDSSAICPTTSGQINKLMGFSDCNQHQHQNSARFGWRWYNDQLEIWTYYYNDGVRKYNKISNIDLNTWNSYTIAITSDKYIFKLNDTVIIEDRTANCNTGFYFILYPYFGGTETCNHDITIAIKKQE